MDHVVDLKVPCRSRRLMFRTVFSRKGIWYAIISRDLWNIDGSVFMYGYITLLWHGIYCFHPERATVRYRIVLRATTLNHEVVLDHYVPCRSRGLMCRTVLSRKGIWYAMISRDLFRYLALWWAHH